MNGLAAQHKINALADRLTKTTHFSSAECKALISLHFNLQAAADGFLDRMRMREVLHVIFEITDEVMLDLVFTTFDKDNDGWVDELEWVQGLSMMLRGTSEELSDWCYSVYDINGDGGLAREELSHCLKGCIFSGYGVEVDEIEDCEREIVEICMKKLDVDMDGQITLQDFKKAVKKDPLMLVSVGPCLPPPKSCAVFLSLVTERYRLYTGPLGRTKRVKGSHGRQSQGRPTQDLGRPSISENKPAEAVSMTPSAVGI